ncbi:MAG: tandem-95 repeat protein [Verrucomicrobia bacterium]|nr:tandem-95 repeat protein [Verrucomicrobiota bacterium]
MIRRALQRLALAVVFLCSALAASAATQIIYVSADAPGGGNGSSWASAYNDLQAALTAASPTSDNPVEIWLKTGVYKPTSGTDRTIRFNLKSYLTLRGGFAGTETDPNQRIDSNLATVFTVLSGDIGNPQPDAVTSTTNVNDLANRSFSVSNANAQDNSYNVVRAYGVTSTRLDRLVVAGGYANSTAVSEVQIESMLQPSMADGGGYQQGIDDRVNGGGIFSGNSNLIVQDCWIVGNFAKGIGGGIVVRGGLINVQDTRLVRNVTAYGGGGLCVQSSTIVALNRNTFYGNSSAYLGGGLLLQVDTDNKYVKAYAASALAGTAALTYNQPVPTGNVQSDPKLDYDTYRIATASFAVAKTLAKVAGEKAGLLEAKLTVSPLTLFATKGATSALSATYTWVSFGVTAVDLGVQIALFLGADPNDPFIKGWTVFSNGFAAYATPTGLAKTIYNLILGLATPTPSFEERATKLRNKDYDDNHNSAERDELYDNVFQKNYAAGYGGGAMILRQNVLFHRSRFIENEANYGGGALAGFVYNDVFIENSAFVRNRSAFGHSALAFGFRSVDRLINLTITQNFSNTTTCCAVGADAGADVSVLNSILWNNQNLTWATGGADFFATRKDDLDAAGLKAYNDAGDSHGLFTGIIDFQYCDVQGLNLGSFTYGTALFWPTVANFDANVDPYGMNVQSHCPNVGEGVRPGSGVRGNFSRDPYLLQDIYPHPTSPVINRGSPSSYYWNGYGDDINRRYRDTANNPVDVGAVESDGTLPAGTIVYVDGSIAASGDGLSWAGAKKTLAEAFTQPLAPGGQIFVAKGTYTVTSDSNRSATLSLRPGVSVTGGLYNGAPSADYSNPASYPTIITGNIANPASAADNSYCLIDGRGQSDSVILPRIIRGFTFTQATSNSAAVWVTAPIVVQGCTFLQNTGGRALQIDPRSNYHPEDLAQVSDCTFDRNTAGAIGCNAYSLDVLRTNFYDNTSAVGGAIDFPNTDWNTELKLERCLFYHNSATAGRGGGVRYRGFTLTIAQSVFADNTAAPVSTDTATTGGAGFYWDFPTDRTAYLDDYNWVTVNSIFYGNRLTGTFAPTSLEAQQFGTAADITSKFGSWPGRSFRGNDVEGLNRLAARNTADLNVDYDPFFVAPASHNFTPAFDSQLINHGTAYSSVTDTLTATYGGVRDIGLVETTSTSSFSLISLSSIAIPANDNGRTYLITADPPYNTGADYYVWEVRRPGAADWVTVVNDTWTSGASTGTLTLVKPPHTWNGSVYRLRILYTGVRRFSNEITIAIQPSMLYVKPAATGTGDGTTWANASTLANAVKIAVPYTQIWVAQGTYSFTPSYTAPLGLPSGARLRGGFAGTETDLAQRPAPGSAVSHLVSANGLNLFAVSGDPGVPTIIDRFTCDRGSSSSPIGDFAYVFQLVNANTALTSMTFNGPAVDVLVNGGQVSFTGCSFTGAYNAVSLKNTTASVSASTFANNGNAQSDTWAAAITSINSTLAVADSNFTGNGGRYAAAIYSQGSSGPIDIQRCRFLDNTGFRFGGAVVINNSAGGRIANSLFARNATVLADGYGAGLATASAPVTVVHCTFVANSSANAPAIFSGGGSLQLVNSIVWGSTYTANSQVPANFRSAIGGSIATTNSLVQGGGAYDPFFDPASADYALTAYSPALNRGGTDDTLSGQYDLGGNLRRYAGGAADLGASEFIGAAGTPVYLSSSLSDQTVYVERTATFALSGSVGSTVGSASFTWEYNNGSAWVPVSGLTNASVAATSTGTTLTLTGVTLAQNGLQVRATAPGIGSVGTATLTVKSRVILYVDSRVSSSGNGLTWGTAFKTISAAVNAATADTDIWVAGGDYADAGVALPAGARLYLGFGGDETDVTLRDPVAHPIRIGKPLADVTLVIDDSTALFPPLTLTAGQSARWQVDTGSGFVDLVADADRIISVVNGVPGLTLHANPALTGYRYRVVVSDATGDLFSSDSAQVTVIARPTVYVDAAATGGAQTGADWANAFNDLSAALAAYTAYADFKIAEGTYTAPAGTPFNLRRSLTLTGGYVAGTETRDPAAHLTILQSASGTVASAIALRANADRGAVDSLTVVDGFVFRSAGTGLALTNASPQIRHCRFENLVTGIAASNATLVVEDSVFTGQSLSGIRLAGNGASLTVTRGTFTGNSAGTDPYVGGGAIGLGGDSVAPAGAQTLVLTDCVFTGNSALLGGAVSSRNFYSTVVITRCRFDGNSATSTGGAILAASYGTLTIRDSLLVRNQSAYDGGAIKSDSPATLIFTTVAANRAGAYQSYVAVMAQGLTLRDSILWGNTAGSTNYGEYGQYGTNNGPVNFADSIVDGLARTSGARLLPFDPRFVDAANGDFRLAPDSPALGLANSADLITDETDLAGTARLSGSADLGAYESAATPAPTYVFINLPASLSGYAGTNLPVLAQTVPSGWSGAWQYFDGSSWSSLPDSSSRALPGASNVFVNSQANSTALTIYGITAALDGTALRFALTSGSTTYTSPSIPVTVLPFAALYVDGSVSVSGDGQSWPGAFKTLQEALAAVDAGRRVVYVAEGSYRGPFTLPMRFEMYGGFPAGGAAFASRDPAAHPTILTGLAANGTDRADCVVSFAYSGSGYSQPVFDGFVVENGHTGLSTAVGVAPALRHLVVRGHDATGLVLNQSSGASITDSVFENNTGTDGGALRTSGGSQIVIERVVFRGNSATRGGALFLNDFGTQLRSVLITGNVADTGGGLHFAGSGAQLTQVTLAGNRARLGDAIYTANTVLAVRNSIAWGNRATSGDATVQFAAAFSGTAFVFDHVIAEQAPSTAGVLRFDPLFVSAVDASSAPSTAGDYSVRAVSPAIDAGTSALASGITLDVAGQPRIVGTVDLGAYESASTGITPLALTGQPGALTYKRSGTGNTFSVTATGAASYLWQYAGSDGIWLSLDGVAGFSGATTATLTVTSATSTLNGYRFRAAITGTDGSVITSDAQTLTVYPSRFYVNAARSGTDTGDGLAWATAFRTLDAALAATPLDPEGTEFWIAAGTYTPATVYNVRSGLAFYGGFAGTESTLAERDLAANVTAFTAAASQASIFSATAASGIALPVQFNGVTFRDSAATTAVTSLSCATVFDRVTFTAIQAALFSRDATVTLRRIEVRGNTSGAIFLNVIGGSVLVENSLFAGNVSTGTGRLAYFAAPAVLRQVTVASNRGDIAPFTFADANNQTYNSIFWGNRGATNASLATSLGSSARFYVIWNSVVENLAALTASTTSTSADLATDPRFVDAANGDFRLASDSPAIDTGKNDQISSDLIDLAGQSRLHGVYVDRGAYEYQADDLYALTTQPVSTYASAVTPAVFTVAGSRSATFVWEVSSDSGAHYTTVSGANAATLSVPGTAEVDGYLYRARVQFTTGPELVSNAATLTFLNPVATATAPAGYATPATFAATANQPVTAWQWQVSVGGAAYTDVPGATATTLSVAGDAGYGIRNYRVQATFGNGSVVVSNSVQFVYADAVPASTSSSALAFAIPGSGVQTDSLTDATFAVLPQFAGRLSLIAGDFAPVFNDANVSFTFAEPLAAGSRVFVTSTSGLLRADGVGARPRVWEYRVPTVSGAGAFASATTLSNATATTLAPGDLDGDGTIDILVADTDGLRVWRNDGLGSFTADASAFGSANARAIALGSLTANATLDAVVVTASGDVEIWTNDATGHFTLAQTLPGLSARAVALGDLDADGDVDLVVATDTGTRVYLNNGSGTFTAGATFGSAATSVALGDLNLDGTLDAIVGSATGTVIYSNNAATFTAAYTSATPADRVTLADLDADGRLDVILTRADQPARLWRNTGAFQFTALAAAPGGGSIATLAAGDIDGDGRADLILTDAVGTTAPWLTSSALASAPVAGQPLLNLGTEVALADLDGDGTLDLVGLDATGHPVVSLYHLTPTVLDQDASASLASAGFSPTPTMVHIVSLPAHGTLLNGATPVQVGDAFTLAAAASLTYTPAASFNGLDAFTWSATDGGTAHAYGLLIRLVPGAVTATNDTLTVAQGGTATSAASVLANDTNNDPGTFVALLVTRPAHGTLTLNTDGTFTYVHDGSETRSDSFTYRAKNTFTGAYADASVTITVTNVNDAPTAVSLTPAAGTRYTGQAPGDTVGTLTAADPDPEDAGLHTFTLVTGTGSSGNADFAISGTSLQTAGPIDFSLGLTRSVRIRATDPAGLWFEQTFTITFTQAPTPTAASVTTDEDTAKAITLSATGGTAALTYEIVDTPAHGTLTGTVPNLTYTPAQDYNGSDAFTFRVTDGTVTSAPATVALTINPVNDAPTLDTHAVNTDEDTPVTFTLAGHDVEGDALTYHIYTNPRLGSLIIDGASATYIPNHLGGRAGTEDSFLLYVTDGQLLSEPVLFTAHVTPVPHAPVLDALPGGGFGGFKNQPITFTVHATDLDGDALTYHVGTAPAHGQVGINGTTVTYIPAYNSSGPDSFTIVASDAALDSAPVTATVAVSDPAPTAYSLSFTGAQHSAITGYLQGSDPLNDPLTYQIVTSPAHGTIALRTEIFNGAITYWVDYTPDAAFSGDDTLTYVAIDSGNQSSDPATVTFHVTANNLAPVASNVSVSQLGLASTAAITLAATDAEGATLTYRIVTAPAHGQLTGDGSAAVTYTLTTAPFVGTDSFTYVANDGTQDSAPATVSLTFTKDVRAAHTVGDVATVYRGLYADIDVLANDHDDWGDPMFIFAVTQPAHGTVTKFSDHVHYQHNGDDATQDEFTYTVSNFSGLTVTEHVFVSIADHTINVTSNADSGDGTLRAAIDTVNRYAFTPVQPSGDRANWTITLLLSGDNAVIEPIAIGTSNPDAPAAATRDQLDDSAYEIQGNAVIRGLADNDRTTLRVTGGSHLRLFYIDPRAHVTLRNLTLTNGTSNFGGAILNDGDLTLENVTLDSNTATSDGTTPARGGGLYQRGISSFGAASLALTNVTFTANLAAEGAGLYQAGGTVVAHSATFSGHDATARDYRIAAGSFTAESLTADTPGAPWFGPISATTIRRLFSQTIPVDFTSAHSLTVTSQVPWSSEPSILISGPSYSVSGRGATRTVSADLGASPDAGPQYLTATASGGGASFTRTATVTVDPAVVRSPVAVDDYITAARNSTIQIHDLLLANDTDPDGQTLFITDYSQPQYGSVSEIGGVLSYTAPSLADGSEETFTYTITNGSATATATVHVLIRADRNTGITSAADSDAGSLRAAVAQAAQYGAQPWTIVPNGLGSATLTVGSAGETDTELGDSAFVITTDVTIDGTGLPGFTLSPDPAAAPMRLFRIAPGGKLTLRNLTVSGGSAHLGGAIYNEGTLILDAATLSGNTATASDTAGGQGGAIYNHGGSVSLVNSSAIEANTAADASESIFGLGGAIYTRDGAVAFNASSLADNVAHNGGGIYTEGVSGASVSFDTSVLDNPYSIADLAATGPVAIDRTNSTIGRIDGPSIGSLTNQTVNRDDYTGETNGSVVFTASDEIAGLALSASSSVDGVIPNSSLVIDTTDGVHHLNFSAALSGLSHLTLTASANGVSFSEHFLVVANTGTAANPTVYPQTGGAIYPFGSRILDVITGKVYNPDGSQLSGGNGPASDPLGLPLTVVSVTQPAHGTATINSDGRIVYTHTDPNFTDGSDEFFFTVSNGFGGTATTGAQVTIQPAQLTVTSIAQLDAAIATAVSQPATAWLININAGSNASWYTDTLLQAGADYRAISITAGHITIDASGSPGFALRIGAYGPPPRFFTVNAGAELILKNIRLVGGQVYDAFGSPKGGAVLNRGTFTADHVSFENNSTYQPGTGGALYNDGGTATLTDCAFTNNSTLSTGAGGAIASRNGTLSLTNVTFSNNTAATAKDVYIVGDSATATITHSGTFVSSYLYTTLNGGSVNGLPLPAKAVAVNDEIHPRSDLVAVVPTDLLLANDTGDSLTFVSATDGSSGTVTVADGLLTYTPDYPADPDYDSFTYTIQDANGNTATATVNFVPWPANQAPTLDRPANLTIPGESPQQTVTLTGISPGFDGAGQHVTLTATSSNPALIPTPTVTYNDGDATGSLAFTPAALASGSAVITVTAQDDGGTADGGVDTFSRTFTVTVTPVNHAPTLNAIANPADILENAGDQNIALSGITIGPADSGQTLTVTATSSNPALIADPAVTYTSPNPTSSLTYSPVSGQSGTATITVTVKDNGGGADTVTQSFTVTVIPVNDPPTLDPIADPAAIRANSGQQVIALTGISAGYLESQHLTVTAVSDNTALIPNPSVSYTSPAATGTLRYTPVAHASGTAHITVTVQDDGGTANGGVDTFTQTFTVTVSSGPAPAPALTIAPRTGGGVTVQLSGEANLTYTLYVSTDLVTWTALTTATTDLAGHATIDDTTAPAEGAARFYRADAD